LETSKDCLQLFQIVILAILEKKSTVLTNLISRIYGHEIILSHGVMEEKSYLFFLKPLKGFLVFQIFLQKISALVQLKISKKRTNVNY
jgi:hypothetical protein